MKKLFLLFIIAVFTLQSCATLLAPKKNTLAVTSNPSGADVIVNGYKMGETPVELQTQAAETPVTKIATLKEIEMEAIKSSVERNKWNMTTTAEELGISRMTLYRKLEQYGLRSKE